MDTQLLKKIIQTDRSYTIIYSEHDSFVALVNNDELERLIDYLDLAKVKAKCTKTTLNPSDTFALRILQEHFNRYVNIDTDIIAGSEQEFLGNT